MSKPSAIAFVKRDENVFADRIVKDPKIEDVKTGIMTERLPKYFVTDIINTAHTAKTTK